MTSAPDPGGPVTLTRPAAEWWRILEGIEAHSRRVTWSAKRL